MIYTNKSVMGRKRMLNKNEMIIASSLIAVPLTAILIAMVTRRSRNRLLKRNTLSRQRSSETNTITNNPTTTTTTTTITHTHNQQNEEEEEEEEIDPSESESPHQGSNTIEVTATTAAATTATTTTTISTHMTNNDKEDITIPAALAATVVPVVPSPKEPSNSIGSDMITSSPRRTPKEQEISISDEARKAGESLKELIVAAIKDAKDSAKGKGKRLKEETIGIAATTDSKDIQSLRDNVNTLVGLFEKTIAEIRKEHYDEQIKLLESYRDLLQTQAKVVSARGKMASKLKPGA
jgi:hypothetical protein